jgi:hypothetical protein
MRVVWVVLLCISFPFAIVYPFLDAYAFKHVSFETAVPFEFSNGLLSISSILFGFTSLIIISKEWVDRRIWTVLVPPLALIVLSGVSISNLALGTVNAVQTLLLCSATFNANVVSTGFVVGYITIKLPTKKT